MFNAKAKSFLAALFVAAGATLAAPAAAQASSNFGVYIGGGHSGVYIGSGGHAKPHHRGHRAKNQRHYRQPGARQVNRHGYRHGGFCGPRQAVDKAWRMGVNRPHISHVRDRAIAVDGYRRGYPVKVVFHRGTPNCAVIRTRGF